MPVVTQQFSLNMQGDTNIENITKTVQETINHSGLNAGTITLFIKHTTASIMIIEDEPGIKEDTKTVWNQLIPASAEWQHNIRNAGEDNGHSHLRAQLQGQSVTIPFCDKRLTLGTWQQVVVVDFDTRSRTRDIVVQIIGE